MTSANIKRSHNDLISLWCVHVVKKEMRAWFFQEKAEQESAGFLQNLLNHISASCESESFLNTDTSAE